MKVTMLLADAAQAIDNKLYILGGGWSVTGPEPVPSAIAVKIDVPWDQADSPHLLEIALIDDDGIPVFFGEPEAAQSIVISNEFQVGRPPGVTPGTPLELALAVNIGPLPLEPGRRYLWQLAIDGQSHADWQVAFNTRPRQ